MARILKPGNPPKISKYEFTCPRCGGLIEFSTEDIKQKSPSMFYVECPDIECGQHIDWCMIFTYGTPVNV